MGCVVSSQRVNVASISSTQISWHRVSGKETVLAVLARLDRDIADSEKLHPVQRLAVVTAELKTIQLEIKEFDGIIYPVINTDSYPKIMHQMFVNLKLFSRPVLASENEDFVANVNRKEMRKIELSWLRVREKKLERERQVLHAQLLRIRSLYTELQQLLICLWSNEQRPGSSLESAFERAHALRDALAMVSERLRAAVDYAHTAVKLLDDALPAWKLASVGKSGLERTSACAVACKHLVQARCLERSARRVLASSPAPRASRTLRLVLEYAFTDIIHDQKYQRATETFLMFREALVQIVNSIHQVLFNNIENLAIAEEDLVESRRQLRAARINDLVNKGLADLRYEPAALDSLNKNSA